MLDVEKIKKEEIQALFTMMNSNFCNDNNEQAKLYYDILTHIIKHKRSIISETLNKNQKNRFKFIHDSFIGNSKPKITFNLRNIAINSFYDKFKEEKELKRYLMHDYSKLSKILKKEIKLYCCEFKPDNNCNDSIDMYFRSTDDAIAVELKVDTADHSVVGQIDKYVKKLWASAFTLSYQNVMGVVIANRFTDYVYQELKNEGHICIQYGLNNGRVHLEEV